MCHKASEELQEFAMKHDIPVVSTMMGIGVMPTEHPLYYGMVGNNGKPCANRAMNEADLISGYGNRLQREGRPDRRVRRGLPRAD